MLTRRPFALPFTVLAILTWLLPVSAFADRIGSPYRGPWEDLVGGGQDEQAPATTGGTEGGGGDEGGGGEGGGEGGGAPAAPGGAGGGAGGGGNATAVMDAKITFEWWWEHSKEFYIARASERGRVNMGSSYYWFGGGAKFPPRDIIAVTDRQKATAILGQLGKSLRGDSSASVRAEAAIALGRVAVVAATAEEKKEGQSDNLVVRQLIGALDKERNPDAVHSILLALGMTADKDASSFLIRSYDKRNADEKPWALVALGLSGDPEAVKLLVGELPKSGRSDDSTGIAAVHALGLLGPGTLKEIEAAGGVAKLTKLLDAKGDDALQAQLVRTLALLQIEREKVARMTGTASKNISWMATLSLANYTHSEKDAEAAFKTLQGDNGFGAGDNQSKSYAVLAMGRLADGLDPNSKLRDKILKFLRTEALESRKNAYTRSCAALAMGIAGERSAAPIIGALLTDTTAQDPVMAAACVALGLFKATDQADSIRDNIMLKKRWEGHTRGYGALGIALMSDTTRLPQLKQFGMDKSLTDKTLRMLPLALAILGDRAEVKALIQQFAKVWNKADRVQVSAAAFGLSWIKDQSAVNELIALVEKSPDAEVRGMAIIALGYVGARDRVSPLSRCYENASHHNKFAHWDVLNEISLIL
jgi:HEAT repeat protein